MTLRRWMVASWLVLTSITFVTLYHEMDLHQRWKLAIEHSVTDGVVESVDQRNHSVTTIRFSVGERLYRASVLFCNCQPGDRKKVYYHPPAPAVASVRPPWPQFWRAVIGPTVASIGIGSFLNLIVKFFVVHLVRPK